MSSRGPTKRDEEIVRAVTLAIEAKLTDLSQEEVTELREVLSMKSNIEILFKFGNFGKRFIISLSAFLLATASIINLLPGLKRFLGLPE